MPKKLDLPILRCPDWPTYDRAAWEAALRPRGWFETGGELARHPESRIRIFESAFGRWLGFLSLHNPNIVFESGLDLLSQNRIQAFFEQLKAAVALCTIRAYFTDLLIVVRAMAPHRSFEALHTATRYIWRIAEPITDKYSRLVPARDLYALGFELMDAAPSRSTVLKEAGLYRDGLIIALLIARPVRLSNLASIEIDRHLKKQGDGYWLIFPAAEVKNRRPLEYRLPSALTERIDYYLSDYRPHFLGSYCQKLCMG